jgi:hypothetical protein
MYFVLSKLLWTLAAPSNAIALTIATGAVVSATRFRRIGVAISAIGAFVLLFCGIGPAGVWLLRPLEERFERPANLTTPDGIIVLGGDINPAIFEQRGVLATNGARLTEAVALGRRFPLARLVFTGGSSILGKSIPEARRAVGRQGIGLDLRQDRSRRRGTGGGVEADQGARARGGDGRRGGVAAPGGAVITAPARQNTPDW